MSILLDTNVVSELIRKAPDPAVTSWVSDHPLYDRFFRRSAKPSCVTLRPSSRRADNNVTLDGSLQLFAKPDAIQEFEVRSALYGAQYGTKPGGQLSAFTECGTNEGTAPSKVCAVDAQAQ